MIGCGYNVIEMVQLFKKVNEVYAPYEMGVRRSDDIDECYGDTSYAK